MTEERGKRHKLTDNEQDLATLGFEGIVLEGDEGTHIANAIDQKKAILLFNHGLLTVANTVEGAVFWYVTLDELCQTAMQSLAAVGGNADKLLKVEPEFAAVYVPKTMKTCCGS